jgi:galactokinase
MSNETITVDVPGRVNLIGEWIDFSGGTVLPMPIRRKISLSRTANETDDDIIRSAQFDRPAEYPVNAPADGTWPDAIRGGLQTARALGWISRGQTIEVSSDIPVGQGLSSSAATIVATLKGARPATETDNVFLAREARRVENVFMGVPCGIMDQMAVAAGQPGHALALDTRDCSYELIPIPEDWAFVVIASGVQRALAEGRYKTRQLECQSAVDALGLEWLCDARPADIASLQGAPARRAGHIQSEGQRSLGAVRALKAQDRAGFGELMRASHASLQRDMEVSVPLIDEVVADACRLGADGARITGAGFGGCLVALISPDRLDGWWSQLSRRHPGLRRID